MSTNTASTRSSALETAARMYENEIAGCDVEQPPAVVALLHAVVAPVPPYLRASTQIMI